MQLRYKNTAAPILKNNLATPIKAYEYYEECQTVEELEAIQNDSRLFRLECFMIRERLAGVTSGLLNSLDRYACKYVTDYEHALQIYSHACYLRLSAQIDLDKLTLSLEKCTGVMYQLAECNMILAASEKADQRRKAIYQLVNRIIFADCSAEQKKANIIAQVFTCTSTRFFSTYSNPICTYSQIIVRMWCADKCNGLIW
ncbi:unnamed protein product [Rotaria socialis]|uniref:Uncharacterized protein n=1 Tax=Rotaria socialis TaxID=392032 RepID=A0A821FSS3_9BILA|nr:unnamed protein product [Rotaria socialis]